MSETDFEFPGEIAWLKDEPLKQEVLINFSNYLDQQSQHPEAKKFAEMIKSGEINTENFKEKLEPIGEELDKRLRNSGYETVYTHA